MARKRTKQNTRTKVESFVLAASACALQRFDPDVEVPEGVICGNLSVETTPGPDGTTVRVSGDIVITE